MRDIKITCLSKRKMPFVSTSRRYESAIVNVRVRTRGSDECGVCLCDLCADDACEKTAAETTCCFHAMCCACVAKLVSVCACHPGCKELVFTCPFCRRMSRADAVTMFMSTKGRCDTCQLPPTPVESID